MKRICSICHEEFDEDFELFARNPRFPNICGGCQREMEEDIIGYEND